MTPLYEPPSIEMLAKIDTVRLDLEDNGVIPEKEVSIIVS